MLSSSRYSYFLLLLLLIVSFTNADNISNFTYLALTSASYTFYSGTPINAGFNTTYDSLFLNASNLTGSYLSPAIDAGETAQWLNLTWQTRYAFGRDLPNFRASESYVLTPANMTNNVLLLHFNNQTSFGENNTAISDWSGSYTNATCASTTSCPVYNYTQTKSLGAAASFNGTQYYTFGDILESAVNSTNGSTFALWMRPESTAVNQMMLSKYDNNDARRQFFFRYLTTQKFDMVFYLVNTGVTFREFTTTATYATNSWYHVAFVFNISGDSYKVYVNGVDSAGSKTGSAIAGIPNSAEEVLIGATTSGAANQYKGVLDDVGVWSRMLSATEVSDLYKRGISRYNVSVRTCANSDCSDQSGFSTTFNSSPGVFSLTSRRYFQYNVSMQSDVATQSPEFFNFSIYAADITAPVITVNAPTNNSAYASNTITLNFTPTDGVGVVSCYYSVNDTAYVYITGCQSGQSNQTTFITSNGTGQYVTIYATDAAGNIGTAIVYFSVNSVPSIQLTAPTNTTYTYVNVPLNIIASDSDGIDSCWYSLNGGSNVSFTCSYNATLTAAQGQNYVTVYTNDTFGNINSTTLYFTASYLTSSFNFAPNSPTPNGISGIQLIHRAGSQTGTNLAQDVFNTSVGSNGLTTKWFGTYGNYSGSVLIGSGTKSIVNWTLPSRGRVIFSNVSTPDWTKISTTPISGPELDTYFGFTPSNTDSATNSFTLTSNTFALGSVTITARASSLFRGFDATNTPFWNTTIVNITDGSNGVGFGAVGELTDGQTFDSQTARFQTLLPTGQTYYAYIFFD